METAEPLYPGDFPDPFVLVDCATYCAYATRLAQPFHVDGSDVVGLLCVEPAVRGGLSQIVSSVTVYNEVVRRRPDLAPLLTQPRYFDRYGEARPGEEPWFVMPIVSGLPHRFRFVYLRWYIEKAQTRAEVPRLTDAQLELLDLVDRVAQDPALHLDMDFRPGDVQLLANRTILHARTEYEDHADPARRRHLLRLWLTLHRNAVAGTGLWVASRSSRRSPWLRSEQASPAAATTNTSTASASAPISRAARPPKQTQSSAAWSASSGSTRPRRTPARNPRVDRALATSRHGWEQRVRRVSVSAMSREAQRRRASAASANLERVPLTQCRTLPNRALAASTGWSVCRARIASYGALVR